jgi:glycosyltransferase involved in cell wall biosynthesis
VLVGKFYDQKYVQELRLLAHSLGITGSVDFIPGLKKDELNEVYSQASLFVFTSLIENSPNILLEAMSHGLPTISTDNDPMPEFGATAIEYVKANDDVQLALKIEYLLNNQSLTDELAERSKEQAKMFSWGTFTSDVIQLCSVFCKRN